MEYSIGDKCPHCSIGTLIAAPPSSHSQFECNLCHTTHANAYGTGATSARTTKIKAVSGDKVGRKPRKEIEHRIKRESQVRYIVWRDATDTKVIQVAYTPDGRAKHLDCKACGNKWYLADGPDCSSKFILTDDTLKCLNCGAETRQASTESS